MYTAVTLGDLATALALRLDDPTNQFWPTPELQIHIQDAIRFWNVLTCDNRATYALNLTSGTVWYDFNAISNSPRHCTLTDFDVAQRVQQLLLEGSVPYVLSTAQFTAADIASAIQLKRDEFLLRTGCTRTIYQTHVTPSVERIDMPETVIEAPRAYWLPTQPSTGPTLTPYPLQKTDSFAVTAYQPTQQYSPSDPLTFSAGVETPLVVTLTPPALNEGDVEFITVQSQPLLSGNPAGTPSTILIPNDFIPAIMWGALGYLLSISLEASDKARADYANARFDQYVDAMRHYGFILSAKLQAVPIYADAVEMLDSYAPSWRTTVATPPMVGLSGQNLIGFPSQINQTMTLFMVANATVPSATGDAVQLGREVLDAILDYAQHTLSFKMGGLEFSETAWMVKSIASLAAARNSLVKSMSFYRDAMNRISQRENQVEMESVRNEEAMYQE